MHGPRHPGGHLTEAADHPAVRAEIARAVQAGNTRLSRVEQIKRWALLDQHWDGTTGELTPTFKLKRPVIRDKYAATLDDLHGNPGRHSIDSGRGV